MKDNKENNGEKPDFDDIESRASSEPVKEGFKWGPFSFMRRMFFLDVDPLVNHGFNTRLEPGDVYPEPTVQATRLNSFFEPAWEKEQKKPNPDLRLTIWAGNLSTLLVTAVLYGVSQACSLAGPMLLQRIVAGISCLGSEGAFPPGTITSTALASFLAPALQSLCENHCIFKMYVMGPRMRDSLMAAIYRKCLKLSSSSLQGESQGRVVTLMSNDAQKLQDAAYALHSIWGAPAIIMMVLALLWFQVGWATFVGLGVMLTLIPITGFLAAKLGSYRKDLMGWTDKRVGLMSEIINGIQMIKFYAWEAPFNVEVMKYRNNEADILRALAFWQGMFGMLLFVGPVAVAVFCFGSYSIAGNQLSPAAAYSALPYFSLLRFPLGFLPMLVTMVVNAMVALGRIQGFLLRKEVSDDEAQSRKGTPGEVIIQDGHFVWDEEAMDSVLKDINFEAKPGSLTMIVGSVGSGKSSILSALIGHMSHKSGTMSMGGDVAYVAQTSWIMKDMVQENILMGHDMDPDRYDMVPPGTQGSSSTSRPEDLTQW
ncbi:hypothetical protein CEUSTIGMA_g10427.t1 [Chlamydomonas eustigma]|uniref:ABC transmembrane type-1 domain-containing protein n=1 Tax=Chlamydomonas eustigma TaxID=1157962 RepID=A0A250XJL8_9CHLO|nr:hypothetical protein CEUSTIGMA_g10427.t1 [Chlamydomonas eustigma]|eukprot:GAX83000.1 hypothetical protein CEUSTIGMA_g10427.t1 [Chlamydomonas eustigma]